MQIIKKEELENLKEAINTVNSKKDLLKIVQENDILKSFFVFCKTAKIADSKQLLLQIVSDKLQIFAVQKELQQVKNSKSKSKTNKRTVSEKENSSLFSVFDLIFDKSKTLIQEDYLNSENVKSIFSEDKQKNYKADLYRRIKKFNDLSKKSDKNEKEETEFENLKTYLSNVFDCETEELTTVLDTVNSDSIKIASENLANERVKEYNFDSFESYVKILKVYTIALDSNNLTELERVLEGFLNFVETLQNQESSEKTEKSDENS